MRRTEKKEAPAQANLFADFNGIEFEEMIDFYHHGTNWSNRMILTKSPKKTKEKIGFEVKEDRAGYVKRAKGRKTKT